MDSPSIGGGRICTKLVQFLLLHFFFYFSCLLFSVSLSLLFSSCCLKQKQIYFLKYMESSRSFAYRWTKDCTIIRCDCACLNKNDSNNDDKVESLKHKTELYKDIHIEWDRYRTENASIQYVIRFLPVWIQSPWKVQINGYGFGVFFSFSPM